MKRIIIENKIRFLVSFFAILVTVLSFSNYIYNFNLAKEAFIAMQNGSLDFVASYEKKDAFNVFLDIINLTNFRLLILISPIIAILPNLFDNKVKNYKSALIIPLSLVLLFILSFIFSPNFTINDSYLNSLIMNYQYNNSAFIYILLLLINSFALGLYFINISDLLSKLFQSRVHTLIFSFIFIAFVTFIVELIPQISLLNLFYDLKLLMLNTVFIIIITSVSFLTVKFRH